MALRTVFRHAAALALAGTLSSWAHAAPIMWTLTDVLFNDGGTATGSFVYDATTNAYSNISITTTDAALAPVATFTASLFPTATDVALVPSPPPALTGQATFQLRFQFPLTDAGGLVLLYNPFFAAASSFDGTCLNDGCSSVAYARLVEDGGVIGTPYVEVVPVPAAGLLLASGIGALGIARRIRGDRKAAPFPR